MSPEQALGDPNLGPASDLYSLGAVLFQMVTGGPPFDGDSSQQIVGKHIADPPPSASDVNAKVPRELSDVILRLLAKQPSDRFRSAGEVIAALEGGKHTGTMRSRASAAAAATELLVSGATTRGRKVEKPGVRRGRRSVWIGITVLLLLGLGGAWFLMPPTLVFENRLAGMVTVQVGGEERRILPGGSFTLNPTRGRPLRLSWQLDRQTGASFGDTITIERPAGRIRVAATARPKGGTYFAPLITNETGQTLTITINAGLKGALPCNCTVPPGAIRMEIGYYPLFANSTVRAEEVGATRTATFRGLGPQVDQTSGRVGLLFRAADLRSP